MPRTLLVMRHAKSSWQEEELPDHERPLTRRGKKAARRSGEELAARHLTPDIVLSSTAERARLTVRQFIKGSRYDGDVRFDASLYLSEIPEHLRALQQLPDEAHTALLVGHNPTLEELVTLLSGHRTQLPTATVVCLMLPIDQWSQISEQTRGSVGFILSPKEPDT
ncbi:MAG: histidine phosphatase family protein [Chloroflexi bacterium]|nr:histidine phosphatase family protein [Chloroflexota bacterium]